MTPSRVARDLWFGYWSAMRRYHRFSVRGIERIRDAGPVLVVGYHGRPIAYDLCMLQALLLEETGRIPRAVIHRAFARTPVLRWLFEGGEFLSGEEDRIAQAVSDGASIIVTPGGTQEGCRSALHRYRVDWGGRLGYLRLAARHGLPILPAASSGIDDGYLGLNDGHLWGKRLGLPQGLPAWVGVGPLGIWPLSPPFPVRITLHLGEPIFPREISPADPDDKQAWLASHALVQRRVQGLLDLARGAPSVTERPS